MKNSLDLDFMFKLLGIFLIFFGFLAMNYIVPGEVSQYGLCSGDSYPFGALGIPLFLVGSILILLSDKISGRIKK